MRLYQQFYAGFIKMRNHFAINSADLSNDSFSPLGKWIAPKNLHAVILIVDGNQASIIQSIHLQPKSKQDKLYCVVFGALKQSWTRQTQSQKYVGFTSFQSLITTRC